MVEVETEKRKHATGLWAARSRQRCVGVHEPEMEEDNQVGPTTPVVPELAEAEALTTENLEKYVETNSRWVSPRLRSYNSWFPRGLICCALTASGWGRLLGGFPASARFVLYCNFLHVCSFAQSTSAGCDDMSHAVLAHLYPPVYYN